MKPSERIFVAGHRGLVGSALVRKLTAAGYDNVVTATRQELDLADHSATAAWLHAKKPDVVILAAAKVGGIAANQSLPADFIAENLAISTSVIMGSFQAGVKTLLNLGSACIYPKHAEQPIRESALLTGPLEPTNEPYAVAKIAALKLCEALRRQHGVRYFSLMPNNLYGPGDNYHPGHSHVIPGLIRRFYEAKLAGQSEVVVWGTGSPKREFLYSDDLAAACLHVLALDNPPDVMNVGTGEDMPISDLVRLVAETTGYAGRIVNDTSKPDGTPRKLLDSTRLITTGWRALVGLAEGLRRTFEDFTLSLGNGTARI